MQRHILRIAVVTLLAFTAQAAYSPAAHALQQMRAVKCCAENCKHPQSFSAASQCGCCQTAAAPGNASVAASTKPEVPAPATVVVANVEPAFVSGSAQSVQIMPSASQRAAPIFLLTLSIRL